MSEEITVITITRNRPQLLLRAMASVQRQKCEHSISHLILVDDCEQTKLMLERSFELPQNVMWRSISRDANEHSGPGRSSRLRNLGVQSSTAEWIAFLDDDNEWLENHLQALIASAHTTGYTAVHSYLQMVNSDGTPYLEERLPWSKEPTDTGN
jgi:glycosyltransferase involved in cell wall biosynthesis